MYNFIDITESQTGSNLPSEAISINGEYVEELLPGYRTLYTEGREMLESEVTEIQIGSQNGSRYQYKRDASREIVVHYQMLSSSPEDFREKFNELCKILDQEQMKIIFADEDDKYFIGTKTSFDAPEPGRLSTTGSYTIYCADPYKYSVADKTAKNNGSNQIVLQNNGSKPCVVNVKATMKSDNGYIGFTLDDRFYQIGNPEEVDGYDYQKTEKLFDDHLYEDKGWLVNQGITPPVTTERLQNGVVRYVKEYENEGYVRTEDYASGNSWHGASVTKIVPTDSNRKYPTNWKSSYRFDFNPAGMSNRGVAVGHNSMTYSDEEGNIILSIVIEDNNPTLEKSDLYIYVEDKRVLAMKNTDKFYDTLREENHAVDIEKIGSQITIRYGKKGINKTYQLNYPERELRKITWYGAAYQTYQFMRNNLLRAANCYKHNVDKFEDIPNYFANGDVVEVDGETGDVYINDVYNMDVADIGSQPLLLPPGQHTMGIITSNFSSVPDVEVSFRERWI